MIRQPRIIGLDISTVSTGLAMPDGTTRTIRPRADAKHPARRLNEILSLLDPYLRLAKADLAVIEGYSPGGKGGPYVMLRLAEVGGAVRLRLFEMDVPYVEIAPSRLKLYATGRGNATKEEVVTAALNEGAAVQNNDEADAFWLFTLGIHGMVGKAPRYLQAEIADKRAKVINAINWPAKVAP